MNTTREPTPEILSNLFIEHLKSTLLKQAIDAIRPAVREAVDAAVAEMSPAVQTYLDLQKNGLIVKIITQEIPAK